MLRQTQPGLNKHVLPALGDASTFFLRAGELYAALQLGPGQDVGRVWLLNVRCLTCTKDEVAFTVKLPMVEVALKPRAAGAKPKWPGHSDESDLSEASGAHPSCSSDVESLASDVEGAVAEEVEEADATDVAAAAADLDVEVPDAEVADHPSYVLFNNGFSPAPTTPTTRIAKSVYCQGG